MSIWLNYNLKLQCTCKFKNFKNSKYPFFIFSLIIIFMTIASNYKIFFQLPSFLNELCAFLCSRMQQLLQICPFKTRFDKTALIPWLFSATANLLLKFICIEFCGDYLTNNKNDILLFLNKILLLKFTDLSHFKVRIVLNLLYFPFGKFFNVSKGSWWKFFDVNFFEISVVISIEILCSTIIFSSS